MRKIILIVCSFVICAIVGYMIGSGMNYDPSVAIVDYVVSEDGSTMTIRVGVMSSIGYVRNVNDEVKDGTHTLGFYKCWGGFNSSLGAQNEFTLNLNPEDTEIYIIRSNDYDLVLYKNSETGEWIRD